jgi:hypothetical protein
MIDFILQVICTSHMSYLVINYCVKCPVRILNNTSEVEQGEKVLNCVPGSSNCQSTYRQPCVGRRIIANFNQVTHVRSTNKPSISSNILWTKWSCRVSWPLFPTVKLETLVFWWGPDCAWQHLYLSFIIKK